MDSHVLTTIRSTRLKAQSFTEQANVSRETLGGCIAASSDEAVKAGHKAG